MNRVSGMQFSVRRIAENESPNNNDIICNMSETFVCLATAEEVELRTVLYFTGQVSKTKGHVAGIIVMTY